MSMRASGLMFPATTPSDATAAASPKMAAAEKARCNSCSDGMARLEDRLRAGRLVQQNLQRRDVGVPLDQGRLRSEARNRLPIERPHRRRNSGAVGIDETGAARVETGKVDLGHRVGGNGGHIGV